MGRCVLKWQYGVFSEEMRTYYLYGSLNALKCKAHELCKDNKITYIAIYEIKEIVKDTKLEVARLELAEEH